jgi:Type II CAAX prenyl endopeptidase Rce1-like
MNPDRFSNRALVVFVLIGAIGMAAFLLLHDRAFPEASIDLAMSRQEAIDTSREFLVSLGFELNGYKPAAVFKRRQKEVDYLERNLGLKAANRIFEETLAVWRWKVRWFAELNETEYRVEYTPDGRLASFNRKLPEAEPALDLTEQDALGQAREFLAESAGLDPDALVYIERTTNKRPERMDQTLVWRLPDFDVEGAQVRYSVSFQGEQISKLSQWLRIPEQWTRDQKELKSQRGLLSMVDSLAMLVLLIVMVVVLFQRIYRREIRWRAALFIGAAMAVIVGMAMINDFPLASFQYKTTETFSAFWLSAIQKVLFATVGAGVGMLLVFAASDAEGKAGLGNRPWSSGVFSRRFLLSGESKRQTAAGYAMAFAAAGYVTLFYVLGAELFGAWTPVDVPITDTMSTYFPPLYAILIGFSAAMGEEMIFRLFAIAILMRLTKQKWLALLIPAILWGFGHTDYPQEPIWVRGVELSIAGVIYGAIFLRYGLLTTLTSHYVYNCLMGVAPLVQSGRIGLIVSSAFALLLPVIVLAAIRPLLARAGERKPKIPTPIKEPAPEAVRPDVVGPSPSFEVVPAKRLAILTIAAAAIFLLGWNLPSLDFYRDPPPITLTKEKAQDRSREVLESLGADLDGYRSYIFYKDISERLPNYVFDRFDRNEVYSNYGEWFSYSPYWSIRWYKPGQVLRYGTELDDSGRLRSFAFRLPDKQLGAKISQSEAEVIAREFAREWNLYGAETWDVAKVEKKDLPNRWDYQFTFQDPNFKIGELERRESIFVAGDQVNYASWDYAKTPAQFKRDREIAKKSRRNGVRRIARGVVGFGLFGFGLVWFVILLQRRYVNKDDLKRAALVAIALGTAPRLIALVNELPSLFYGYYQHTEQTLLVFGSYEVLSDLAGVLALSIEMFVIFLAIQVFLRAWEPEIGGAKNLLTPLHPRYWGHAVNLSGVALGAGLAMLWAGGEMLVSYIQPLFLPELYSPASKVASLSVNQLSETLRLLSKVTWVADDGLLYLAAALLVRRFARKTHWLAVGAVVWAFLYMGTKSISYEHLAFAWVVGLVEATAALLIVMHVTRWNLMAYAIFGWLTTVWYFNGALRYLDSPSPEFFLAAIQRIVVGFLPVLLVLGFGLWRRMKDREPG